MTDTGHDPRPRQVDEKSVATLQQQRAVAFLQRNYNTKVCLKSGNGSGRKGRGAYILLGVRHMLRLDRSAAVVPDDCSATAAGTGVTTATTAPVLATGGQRRASTLKNPFVAAADSDGDGARTFDNVEFIHSNRDLLR
jgi:hypothetical protein